MTLDNTINHGDTTGTAKNLFLAVPAVSPWFELPFSG
jgi:hypothetical protein